MNLEEHYEKHGDLVPWSVTKLNMARCPFAADRYIRAGYGYDFKSPQEQVGKENLFAGICIHEMLENWHNAHLDVEDFTTSGEIVASHNIVSSSDWLKLHREFEKAKLVFRYDLDSNPDFVGGSIVGVEQVIEVDEKGQVTEKGKGYLKGTMDLVQYNEEKQVVTITDYKRQWNVLSITDLENNFQMKFYAFLVSCMYPNAIEIITRLYFTRYGNFVEVRRTKEDAWSELPGFIAIAQGINSVLRSHAKDATPLPGEHCELCNYTLICPVIDEIDGVIKDFEEAIRAASLLSLRSKQKSDLDSSIRKFTSKHGPIDTGSKKVGYIPSKTISWEVFDPEMLVALMEKHSIDPISMLSPDSRKINKFMKSEGYKADKGDDEVYMDLVRCVRKKQKTMFRSQKK